MGLFGAVRGIGRIVRGKGKEGMRDLRNAVGDAGDLAKKAAPFAALVPGVGTGLAAGLGFAGGMAGQLNDADGFQLVDGLKEGAISGAAAYGAGKLSHGIRSGSFGPLKLPGMGGGAGGSGALGPRGLPGILGAAGQAAGVVGPDGKPNWGRILAAGAAAIPAGLGIAEAARSGGRQDRLLDAQTRLVEEQAAAARGLLEERKPIRSAINTALTSRLSAGPRPLPDLGGLRDSTNPFRPRFSTTGAPASTAAPAPALAPGAAAPTAASTAPAGGGRLRPGPLPLPRRRLPQRGGVSIPIPA